LNDEAAVLSTMQASSAFKSFPAQHKLTPSAVSALREALKSSSVRFNLQDEGMRLCSERGWVHVESTDALGLDLCYFIPTRLHEK
jgi:hypothetical protein